MFRFLEHWMLLLAALVLILCQERVFVSAVDDSDHERDIEDIADHEDLADLKDLEDLEEVLYSERAASDKIVVCYVAAWSHYRTGKGKFTAKNVPTRLCSHIVYSFAVLDHNTYEMKAHNYQLDIEHNGYKSYTDLKNPTTKVMLSLGGLTDSNSVAGEKYEKMAADDILRAKFVSSAVSFLKKYNFDGLDLHWEYPTHRDRFSQLIRDLRTALNIKNLLFSVAIGAEKNTIEKGYDFGVLCNNLDFINLMSYNFHESRKGVTSHHTDFRMLVGAHKYLKSRNACIDKITLGMASYGRSFKLADPNNKRTGAPTSGAGEMGPFTETEGYLGYNEFCVKRGSYSRKYLRPAKSCVAVKGTTWLGIDTPRSIYQKTNWARKKGFKGAMMWSIDTDDFRGDCQRRKYPLLQTMNKRIYI